MKIHAELLGFIAGLVLTALLIKATTGHEAITDLLRQWSQLP